MGDDAVVNYLTPPVMDGYQLLKSFKDGKLEVDVWGKQ